MKRILLFSALALTLTGCSSIGSGCKSFESNTLGLSRTVTLYSADGSVIRTFTDKIRVGDTTNGGGMYIDVQSGAGIKRHFIGGTYIIEEN